MLQAALVIFLIGSALCGLAQGMTELIAFRAIQGLGGGGLMVSAQAAIGDVVSPRERGRYPGFFGAVFGVRRVAGPLIGGFFTTHLELALDLLHQPPARRARARRRWRSRCRARASACSTRSTTLGAVLLGGRADLAGPADHARRQHLRLGLGAVIGLGRDRRSPALVAFVFAERRAAEPILPLPLFRNRVVPWSRARSAS